MNVIIVDDDPIVVKSLQTIITANGTVEVPETGLDGEDAVSLYEKHLPDVLLTDIQMKKMSGLEAASKILDKHPDAKIILLTTFLDNEYIREALKIGTKGYILKQDFEAVLPALFAVNSGQNVLGKQIVDAIPKLISGSDPFVYSKCGINEKEFEIIKQVANGLSNKEIATLLCFSEGTVRNYLSTILEKLNLRDRTQLAVFYYNH